MSLLDEEIKRDVSQELQEVYEILKIFNEKELKNAIELGSVRKTDEGKQIYEKLQEKGYVVYRSLKEDRMEYGIYKKDTRDTLMRYDVLEDVSGNFLSSSERKVDFEDRMKELFGN